MRQPGVTSLALSHTNTSTGSSVSLPLLPLSCRSAFDQPFATATRFGSENADISVKILLLDTYVALN